MNIIAPDYPVPTPNKVLYVSPNGSDITGTGTKVNPFLSIKVAYTAVPDTPDKWFIVALDGVYSITSIENAGATIAWPGLATGSFAFKTGLVFGNDLPTESSTRSKNVCLMSENIGGCKLIGSAEIPFIGFQSELAVYDRGITLSNRGIGRSSLADYYIYTQELEAPLTVKDDPLTLTYPAMLNRPDGPTPPEFFVAGINQFTIPALNGVAATKDINGVTFRCVDTATWDTVLNAGITIFKINLDGGGRHITDLITAETIKFPDIIWEDTTFLWHNGNNVVEFSKLARVDFVEGVCTAVYSNIRVGDNIVGLALIGNKKFITAVGQYGAEITPTSHKIYYKPREATAPATIRYPAITTAFVSGNVKNLEVTGFEIGEFETSAWMAFSQPSSSNNKLKYNIIRDPRGVGVDVGQGVNYEIHGNLFMRCGRRCIQTTNTAANLPVLQNVRITNNTLLFWRERAGIYTQAIRGIHIEGNFLTTLYSQHADVIAVYEGATDCTITKNFAYTPYDIGVRIQEYTKGYYEISNNIFYSDPGLIIDRVQGSLSQAPSPLAFQRESEKATFNVHHNYISHSGGKPNMAQDIWWGIYNRKIRYNILASSNDALDRVTTGLSAGQNGSYIVLNFLQGTGVGATFSVAMPALYQSAYEGLLPAAYNGSNTPSTSWIAGRIVSPVGGVTMEQFPSGHYAWSYDTTTPNWDGTTWDGLPRVYNNILSHRSGWQDITSLVDNSITITPGSPGITNAIPLAQTSTILASQITYATTVRMKDRVEALAAATRDATGIDGFYDFRSNVALDPLGLIGPDWIGPPVIAEDGDHLSWWLKSAGLFVLAEPSMYNFAPPVLTPSSPQNTFTTLTQPYPVDDNGIWTGLKTQEESEQGISFEVPINSTQLNSPNGIDGEGHDHNVICRWVTPPCQTVGGANEPTYLDVGVMAFHYSKIDRVEFFLNGGTNPTVVRNVTYNPEKDVSAYWVRIEAASLPDSGDAWSSVVRTIEDAKTGQAESPLVLSPQHELQAVVYPKNGSPRILVGKHSNGERGTEPLYSGIGAYTPVGAANPLLEQTSNGIRSFYFSSNNNNTLFTGSIYVDATNGVDDMSRSGDSAFPMQTIEFAYRKLMQLKFKFLNPNSTLIPKSQGDVGGGTIYLKDLGEGFNKFMGHKMGFKNVADTTIPSTVARDGEGDISGGYPFKTLSMFRWLTIRPDPSLTDPLKAKIKGFHYQTRMRDILYATKGIPNTLTKYDGCVIEMDYPYSEYLCGDGPDLSGDPTCAKLQETWDHPVKTGLASQGTWTRTKQGYAIIQLPEKRISGFISSSTAPVGFPKLAPYTWFNNCKLDGRERSRENIYEWADALGLTHSTSFTAITDFNHPSLPQTHKGVFRNNESTSLPQGSTATNGYPNDLIPQVFVKSLIPMKGFSADAGYTFEFSFMSPESTNANCDFTMQDRIQTFLINTHMKNIGEPAMVAADMSINCTYDCYDGDLIRGSLLLYNPHLINAMATKSYVNKTDANFFATHSDVWQPNGGEYSFRRKSVGINNVILHRINNPSPRSPRFDDPIARHGAIGTGRLLEHRFEGQFLYCGSRSGNIDYNYPIEIGGDGLTWQMFGSRYLKDIAVSDCFVRTVNESEELVHRCVIENYLLFNTQIASINDPFVLPMRDQGVGQSAVARRYKDAVPSHPTLNSNNDNDSIDETNFVHYNLASFDNFQYFSISAVNPLEFQDTHQEKLHIYMVNPTNLASPVEVPLRMIPDADGKRKLRENTQSLFSNLDYPFTKVNGEAGSNQIVGTDPNIAFIATALDKTALNLANNPQPNSSTRGTWFVNNLPSTVDGAPYGWYPSDVPHENFLNTHERSNIVVNGEITAGITGSVLSAQNIANGLISPQFLNKEIMGTGGDPFFGGDGAGGTGNNLNQRGFRNKVYYRYTNFDYDNTRSAYGEVSPRSMFENDPTFGEQQAIMNNPENVYRGVQLKAHQKWVPYAQTNTSTDHSMFSGVFGVTETVNYIKDNTIISYNLDGQEVAGIPGLRAMSDGGGDDLGWRWLTWITGYSGGYTAGNNWEYRDAAIAAGLTPGHPQWNDFSWNTNLPQTSISQWYKWGARKFHIHEPFGKPSKGNGNMTEEQMVYQPDAFVCARDGFIDYTKLTAGRTFCNDPMPWITNDVVDGITQGFVPLWKALITGTAGDLSDDVWKRLTGIGGVSAWFDPSDPIKVTSYNGTINVETFRRWRTWFNAGDSMVGTTTNGMGIETNGVGMTTFARRRLEDGLSPFLRAGMKMGLDALVVAPGPVVGINGARPDHFDGNGQNGTPYEQTGITFGVTLDKEWWRFFSTWVVPNFGRDGIYQEAIPTTLGHIAGNPDNPYLGFPVMSVDEYGRAGLGGEAQTNWREHHLSELGEVEFFRNTHWGPTPHIGKINVVTGETTLNGEYWFLGASFGWAAGTGGSGLPALVDQSGSVEQYLRAKRLPVWGSPGTEATGYEGTELWGPYLLAKHLIRKQVHNNEINAVGDRTINRVMISKNMINRLPSNFDNTDGVLFTTPLTGVTMDFIRRFPNILSYANYLAPLRSGAVAINPRNTYSGLTANVTDIAPIAAEYASGVASTEFTYKINGVMWLTVADYDAFAATTKLGGISGGMIYAPVTITTAPTNSTHTDLDMTKFDNWMDIKLQSWMNRYGTTPKYIAWKLTEYDVARETGPSFNRQPTSFEMERYLFLPKTIPQNTTETAGEFRRRNEYFASVPGITWGVGLNSERFVNNGYDIATVSSPEADANYTAAQNAAINMITLAKNWRTRMNLNAKVGIYNLPYLPKSAYNVYAIDTSLGANDLSRVVTSNTGNWNDSVFARQSQSYPFGIEGWHTEAETTVIKNAIKLEYRKRLENVTDACEVLFVSMQNTSSEENIAIDSNVESNKKWHMEVLELGNDLKTKQRWNTVTGAGTDTNPTCELQTLVNIAVVDPELSDFPSTFTPVDGDPFTKSQGTLFNHEQVEYNLIDWVRDDYLRPKYLAPARIQGMSIQSDDMYRATNAMKTGNYTGKTADREWVLKWLVAEDGAGATINWSNAASVDTNIRRFFAVRNSLVKKYLDRFNTGVPRYDITNPYSFMPFAAGWNKGMSGPTFGYYPSSVNGQAITDVVPMAWASTTIDDDGVGFTGGFRSPGNTGNMPSTKFARFSQMVNRIPSGKRVVMPWYWQTESPSSQLIGSDYYKAGTDGVTYNGSQHLFHETPGTVKFISPWADKNTIDSKSSFTAFLAQCVANDVSFDQVANDFEGYGVMSLASTQNAFDNPFGPTGMPAALQVGDNALTGVIPFDNFNIVPDARATQSIVTDPRFTAKKLDASGLTFAAAIERYYHSMNPFAVQMRLQNLPQDAGLTAQKILAYYILEGPTGISAATGPASCSAYYSGSGNVTPNVNEYNGVAGSPWRSPWNGGEFYEFGSNVFASKKRAWFAWDKALRDIVINDHVKTVWMNTLQGSTAKQHRSIAVNLYHHAPIGITEGALIMDYNTHPVVRNSSLPLSATGANIGAAPYLYGEANTTVRSASYFPTPTSDTERYTLAIFNPPNSTPFGSDSKAYISFINDLAQLRAILRSSPNSWKTMAPWLKSPEEQWADAGYYVGDDIANSRSYEAEYLQELAFHTLLSGAQYINYFNPGRSTGVINSTSDSMGFTAGITFMQGIFDTWRTQAESCRVQPASNETGDVNVLVDRVLLSDAGGNHAGFTGTVTSGGKLLKYVSGKTGSVAFGGENNDTYLWRITVPPQAVGGTYARVDYPSAAAVADIPAIVVLPANKTGFWIKRTANSYKPVYRFDIEETIPPFRTNLTNGAGFVGNPDQVFTDGDADTAIGVGDNATIRVIAAWKGDPIPFDKSTETTVTVCAYHPSGIDRVEACLNGGLTGNIKGDDDPSITYQEFTFTIPSNLPATTDFPTGTLHEIRAKIYPKTGFPRILGGTSIESSRYYTANTSLMRLQPSKSDANETSYYLCKEDPSVATVTFVTSQINNLQTHTYTDLRNAILFEMGDVTTFGNLNPYNKKFVKFVITTSPTLGLTQGMPIFGDPRQYDGTFAIDRNGSFSPAIAGQVLANATPTWDTVNKAIVIENNATNAFVPTINAITVIGNSNPAPIPSVAAGFTTDIPGALAPYPPTGNADNGSRWTVLSSVGNPTINAYCTFNVNIYRLNKRSIDTGSGSNGLFIPSDIIPPTGAATDNAGWIFESSVAAYSTNVLLARSVEAFGIGKIKFKNVKMDRGSILNFTSSAIQCDGVTFYSSLQPPTEQSVLSSLAPSSFTGCVLNETRYGLNGARRIVNSNITSPYSDVLMNSSFINNVGVTGAGQKDVIAQTYLGRYEFARKNSIINNVVITGSDAVDITLGTGGGIITGVAGACADHEGLLFKNIIIGNSGNNVGLISRFNGNIHQVFFDGVSFNNQILAIDTTYNVVNNGVINGTLIPFGAKPQKVYLKNSTINDLRFEDATTTPFTPFGTIVGGSTLGVGQIFALNTNYHTGFGINADNITSTTTKPNMDNAQVFIRGIPLQPTTTPTVAQLSLYIKGLGTSGTPTQVYGSQISWAGANLTPAANTTVFNLPANVAAGIRLTAGITLNTFYGSRYIEAGITTETITTAGATYYVHPSAYTNGIWNVANGGIPSTHWIKTGAGSLIAQAPWITNPTTVSRISVKIRGPFSTVAGSTPELEKGHVIIGAFAGTPSSLRDQFIAQWNLPLAAGAGTLMLGGMTFGLGTASISQETNTHAKLPILWGSAFGVSAGLQIWPGSTADFPDFSTASWKIIPQNGSQVIAE